jgi:hypothetical protein
VRLSTERPLASAAGTRVLVWNARREILEPN